MQTQTKCAITTTRKRKLHFFLHGESKLFQSADISRNRFDLRLVEAVRNRAHDCRCVRDFWILTAFFAPIEQFVDDVGIKLTGQARNLAGACSIGTVASSACRDVLIRQPVLEDFPARRHELPRCAAEWRRIERVEICGKSRNHRLAQRMCDVEHDVVCSPMLNESLQLIFQICGLLSGEAWYRVKTTETLRRNTMADFAILQLGLDFLVRDGTLAHVLRRAGCCKGESGQCWQPDRC